MSLFSSYVSLIYALRWQCDRTFAFLKRFRIEKACFAVLMTFAFHLEIEASLSISDFSSVFKCKSISS